MADTQAGVVLGTAPYMSPEQASGEAVDKRADIWGFGVLLYEMLSGRRAFTGKTTSHILVKVLEYEPDWKALPPLPAGVQDLLERCLQKKPENRLRVAYRLLKFGGAKRILFFVDRGNLGKQTEDEFANFGKGMREDPIPGHGYPLSPCRDIFRAHKV